MIKSVSPSPPHHTLKHVKYAGCGFLQPKIPSCSLVTGRGALSTGSSAPNISCMPCVSSAQTCAQRRGGLLKALSRSVFPSRWLGVFSIHNRLRNHFFSLVKRFYRCDVEAYVYILYIHLYSWTTRNLCSLLKRAIWAIFTCAIQPTYKSRAVCFTLAKAVNHSHQVRNIVKIVLDIRGTSYLLKRQGACSCQP